MAWASSASCGMRPLLFPCYPDRRSSQRLEIGCVVSTGISGFAVEIPFALRYSQPSKPEECGKIVKRFHANLLPSIAVSNSGNQNIVRRRKSKNPKIFWRHKIRECLAYPSVQPENLPIAGRRRNPRTRFARSCSRFAKQPPWQQRFEGGRFPPKKTAFISPVP